MAARPLASGRSNPACINSGNPYHRCSSYCYQKISTSATDRVSNYVEEFPLLQRSTTNNMREKSAGQPPAMRVAKSGRDAWRSLFTNGRAVEKNNKCSYIPLRKENSVPWIPKTAVSANVAKWERTLVGYVVGDKPFYSHLRACVHRLWRPKGKLQVYSRDNGFFFFDFDLEEDCRRVLEEGPWTFDKRVIVLRRWTPDLTMDRDLLSSIPVWVRLPDLPLKFWSAECISIITSKVGIPLFLDKATAEGERYSYARCFVEIEATTKLPNTIEVEVEGEDNAFIAVEYENLPPKCVTCDCFGHTVLQCPFKKVWVQTGKQIPMANTVLETDASAGSSLSSQAVHTEEINVSEVDAAIPVSEDGNPSNDRVDDHEQVGNDMSKENERVDDPDNVDYEDEDEDGEDEDEDEWMEEMEEDGTMANPAFEEEMRQLAATSQRSKKKQKEPSPSRKSSRTHRKPKKFL